MFPDAVAAIQQLSNIVNGLRGSNDLNSEQVQQRINRSAELANDALSKALRSQMAQQELVSKLEEAQRKIRSFERWETEKTKYYLKKYKGTYVYQLKPALVRVEHPDHMICPKCYEDGKKSILQYRHGAMYDCNCCKVTLDCLPLP